MSTPQDLEVMRAELLALRAVVKNINEPETQDYERHRLYRKQVLKSNSPSLESDNRTLEKNDTPDSDIEGKLQVFGASSVLPSSLSIPTMSGPNEGDTPASLEWIEVDGGNVSNLGQSLATRSVDVGELTVQRLEIKDFYNPPDADPLADDDEVILRKDSANPVPIYATKAQMQAWLGIEKTNEPWSLDYELSGTTLNLSSGTVFWGTMSFGVSASNGITVANGDCFGIALSTSSASWVKKSAVSDFIDTEDTLYRFYYRFAVVGGVASIDLVGARGDWKIPSVFAPESS
jgi:hypothetical protein